MEISAHSGARPSHSVWQGQIVSLSGRRGYLSKSDIGYGTGAGFGDWNCRHDWYPFYEGISTRNYTQSDIDKLNAKDIEYNGKMYSEYEISQMLRKKEREIRTLKREKIAYKTAIEEGQTSFKSDLTTINGKIKDKSSQIQEFCNQTGYNRDRFREQVGGKTSVGHTSKNRQNNLTSTKNSVNINTRNAFHTYSDPMREVLGSAYDSHPQKVQDILDYLKKVNVDIFVRDENESMCYQPGLRKGQPGQMVLNSQASISAWLHEFQHVLDDEKAGWSGMRVLYDDDEHYKREVNAYNVEIEFAKSMGREDIVDRLKDLLEEERKKIYDSPR